MIVPAIRVELQFPGRAGVLQAGGYSASLFAELGDNYAYYHDDLATRLAAMSQPDPKDFRGDFEGYMDACRSVSQVLGAEVLLRRAFALRQGDRAQLSSFADVPLVDEQERLVSVAGK